MERQYCVHLSPNPIRFDPVSQLTNIFFDDSNQQVFSVRSGGATGITVKGLNATDSKPFRMDDKGKIQSIKFSPNNHILAVHRNPSSVEFMVVNSKGELQTHDPIVYTGKSLPIFGFVWIHTKEVAIFSSGGIDLLQVVPEKKTLKHTKSLNLTINRFEWCPELNFALLHSNKGTILTPVIIRQGTISKLPKLELKQDRKPNVEDITLGVLYGTGAILLLQQTPTRLVEVVIYLLNGPGMAPRMSHVLRLGHGGRFAMNIVDDVILVHHQETKTSLLFDVALKGEADPIDNVTRHSPITTGRPMKPFQLRLPSISNESMMDCELYTKSWVVFTPNIIIDADVGCLWTVEINYTALCSMVGDRIRLAEFLLQRTKGKSHLIQLLQEMISPAEYTPTNLPIIEAIFDRVNAVYKKHLSAELQNQTATPTSGSKPQIVKPGFQPRVVVDQNDVHWQVLQNISDQEHFGKVMMVYLCSLTKHGIVAQNDLSKMIVSALVNAKKFEILRELFTFSLIHESKPLAISLLQLSSLHPIINQMVLDMLAKLNEKDIIVEVLLEQGKIMDALKIAKTLPNFDQLPARKYLEAAMACGDPIVFHSVYMLFQQRNQRTRGYKEFNRSEQCDKYTEHYANLFLKNVT